MVLKGESRLRVLAYEWRLVCLELPAVLTQQTTRLYHLAQTWGKGKERREAYKLSMVKPNNGVRILIKIRYLWEVLLKMIFQLFGPLESWVGKLQETGWRRKEQMTLQNLSFYGTGLPFSCSCRLMPPASAWSQDGRDPRRRQYWDWIQRTPLS